MPLKEIIPPLFGVTDTNVYSGTNEYNELYDPRRFKLHNKKELFPCLLHTE